MYVFLVCSKYLGAANAAYDALSFCPPGSVSVSVSQTLIS